MKIKLVLFVLSVVGSAAVFYFLPVSPYSIAGILALASVATFSFPEKPKKPIVKLGGLSWTREELCHSFKFTGSIGSGKCLKGGTLVMLFSGEVVPVESIKTGDLLMGDDSTPREVTSTTIGYGPLYEIRPTNGDPWVCNSDHVLTLRWNGRKTRHGRGWKDGKEFRDDTKPRIAVRERGIIDIPLSDFIKSKNIHRNPEGAWCTQWMIYRAPANWHESKASANLSTSDFYFAGLWLGDGDSTSLYVDKKGLSFTMQDKELLSWLCQYSDKKGWIYSERDSDKRGTGTKRVILSKPSGVKMHPVHDILESFGYSFGRKQIPLWALTAPRSKRMALLAGLLDTDGHLGNNCFEITQKRKNLADQICFLSRSLGFWSEVVETKKGCQTGAVGIYYRQYISGDTDLITTQLPRKQATTRQQPKNVLNVGWRVSPQGYGTYYGFTLTGNGRFLLGDFTVTHNSTGINALVDQVFANYPDFGGLWLDAKGDSHAHLLRIAKKHGREKDIIMLEVPFEGRRIYPKQTMNLMEAGGMGPEVVAEIIAEIATQGASKDKSSSFFRAQTVEHVAKACEFFKATRAPINAKNLKDFLCDPYRMSHVLKAMGMHTDKLPDGKEVQVPDDNPLTDHWWSYLNQAPDQRSGVVGSIANALTCFASGEVAEIFSSDSTVDFNDINNGKIFCVIIPSSYPRQKAAVNQFMKALFFAFGKKRFDTRKFENQKEPLILCMLDEYQDSAAPADIKSMATLRDAGCVFIAACQDEASLIPVVGRDVQPGLVSKFRNRFIFRPETPESDEDKSKIIGKRRVWRTSYGSSGGKSSSNRSLVDDYVVLPQYFRRGLKKNRCVILHTDGSYRKNVKLPLI